MPKYRYQGEDPADLPTLGRRVKPGETIDVPEEIVNPLFVQEDQQQAQPQQGQQQAQPQPTAQGQQAKAEGQPQRQ